MRLKTCSQNVEIKLSTVQTHNFDGAFLKTIKSGDRTNQFQSNGLVLLEFRTN